MKIKELLIIITLISTIFSPLISVSQAVISADRMNILYKYVENPISVAVSGLEASKIKLKVSGATIKKIDSIHYLVKPHNKSNEVIIKVYSETITKRVDYGSFSYMVKTPPPPSIRIAGFSNEKDSVHIKKAQLLSTPYLIAYSDNFIFNVKYNILGFKISYTLNDTIIEYEVKGNKIPSNILNDIRKTDNSIEMKISEIIASIDNSEYYKVIKSTIIVID